MPNRQGRPEAAHHAQGPRVQRALQLLLHAHKHARAVTQNVWDFAVGLNELITSGIDSSDLRRLVADGLVEHGLDHTSANATYRRIHKVSHLRFSERSSFVLSREGFAIASRVGAIDEQSVGERDVEEPEQPSPASQRKPRWDATRHTLFVGAELVKQFKEPAINQEMILAAFQEESWPERIDDPLPPSADVDPKRRLHDTIVRLNKHQVHALIRFRGDGTGQGLRWELVGRRHQSRTRGAPVRH